MNKRQQRIERLKNVEREYDVARLAIPELSAAVLRKPEILDEKKNGLRQRDLERFSENVETTYFVRIFAEFEAALRDVWRLHYKKSTDPPIRKLIESIVARCGVPDADFQDVDEVREFRNSVVHEGVVSKFKLSLGESRNRLCKFMARLPLNW